MTQAQTALAPVKVPKIVKTPKPTQSATVTEMKPKKTTEDKSSVVIKGAAAKILKGRPTKTNMRRITEMKTHPGSSLRFKRWNATLAEFNKRKAKTQFLTLRDMEQIEGLAAADAIFWHDNKLLVLTEPTAEEMTKAIADWKSKQENS